MLAPRQIIQKRHDLKTAISFFEECVQFPISGKDDKKSILS
jgi:hypothetical protein